MSLTLKAITYLSTTNIPSDRSLTPAPYDGLKQPPNFNRLVIVMHSIEFVVLNTLQQTSGYWGKRRL